MFDQLFESVRKTSESSLKAQQEMFKQWIQDTAPLTAGPPAEWSDALRTRWLEATTEALQAHRQALDAVYRSGIEAIEETFRVSEAKSPDDYRALVEGLWRKLLEGVKAMSEAQAREFQKATDRWLDLAQHARS